MARITKKTIYSAPISEEEISRLISLGFNRWQKGDFDRLYINPETLGLEVEKYKTGNVSYAEFKGEKISNNWGREMLSAKTYIDVITGELVSGSSTLFDAAIELTGIEIDD